jgi:hypothetical protein
MVTVAKGLPFLPGRAANQSLWASMWRRSTAAIEVQAGSASVTWPAKWRRPNSVAATVV